MNRFFSLLISFFMVVHICLLPHPAQGETQFESQSSFILRPAVNTTQPEYWLEAVYGMAGSGIGNASALGLFAILAIVPGFLAQSGEPPLALASHPLTAFLLLLPIFSTAATLYFYYPQMDEIHSDFWMTLAGSALGVLLHALLMLPLIMAFGADTVEQTVIQLAPIGLFSALVVEGLVGAFFYDMSKTWDLQASHFAPGVVLVRHFSF